MEAILFIPRRPEVDATFCQQFSVDNSNCDCDTTTTAAAAPATSRVLLLSCHPRKPGVVWRGINPTFLQSPKSTARKALVCLFESLGYGLLLLDSLSAANGNKQDTTSSDDFSLLEEFQGKAWRRTVKLPLTAITKTGETKIIKRKRLIIWIQPPTTTYFHKCFTQRLVTWEHQMILYQTMAAWISTLGGGYFFCRHLSTALKLAKQQLQIALLMGDYNMAYKCIINQAYSYIYAGQFNMAFKTIDSIDLLNKKVDVHPLDSVIVNMQHSARLFCKRFRRASKKLNKASSSQSGGKEGQEPPPLTFDDYQRIRIVEDQSATKTTDKQAR
jgi:hypothetical protein